MTDHASVKYYTLSLHDALPISRRINSERQLVMTRNSLVIALIAVVVGCKGDGKPGAAALQAMSDLEQCKKDKQRSEEHTSELQSLTNIVCRLLRDKKTRHKHDI